MSTSIINNSTTVLAVRVMAYLAKQRQGVLADEVADMLGVAPGSARAVLKYLVDAGLATAHQYTLTKAQRLASGIGRGTGSRCSYSPTDALRKQVDTFARRLLSD